MRSFARKTLYACLALLLVVAAPVAAFEQSELVVRSGDQAHRFRVELARTPDERSRGLMFRRQMDADLMRTPGRDPHVAQEFPVALLDPAHAATCSLVGSTSRLRALDDGAPPEDVHSSVIAARGWLNLGMGAANWPWSTAPVR